MAIGARWAAGNDLDGCDPYWQPIDIMPGLGNIHQNGDHSWIFLIFLVVLDIADMDRSIGATCLLFFFMVLAWKRTVYRSWLPLQICSFKFCSFDSQLQRDNGPLIAPKKWLWPPVATMTGRMAMPWCCDGNEHCH